MKVIDSYDLIVVIVFMIFIINVNSRSHYQKLYDKGISLCSGNHIFHDALYVIDQVHNIFNSTLPIAINHCHELSYENIDLIKTNYNNTFVWNICDIDKFGDNITNTLFNMEKTKAEKRLKSWFCKSAALIISPFNETMVVDLDVIFFKKPDLLFESSAYRRTHSLFFRDRIAFQAKRARKDEVIYQDIIKNYILSKSNISNINSSIAKEYSNMNGYSFFWKNIANENEDALLDFQDSSIILLDSRWHQKTLEVLEELLPEFSIGWGDKEIYWISATIAQIPFSFEPFLAVFYGDCTSILLHYDPTQELEPIDKITPFYVNGEWILEKVHNMGDWFEEIVALPSYVNESLVLKTLNNNHHMHCSIENNELVLRAQWERLTRSMSRAGPETECINIYKPSALIISNMLKKYIYPIKCKEYGCVYLPININHTYDWFDNYFCDPIIFDDPISQKMANLSKRSVIPPPPMNYKEGDVIKGNGRSVYLIRNNSLHEFPNADTFLKMGYAWDQIVNWPPYMFHYCPISYPLEPL